MAKLVMYPFRSAGQAQNATAFYPIADIGIASSGTEANIRRTVRTAGAYSNLYARILTNTIAATSTLRFRKNGANGTQTLTIGSLATGEFEDTSGTDTVAAADLINLSLVTGASGANALTYGIFGVAFAATTNTVIVHGISTVNFSTASASGFAKYVGYDLTYVATETATEQFKMKVAGTIKNMCAVITTNTRASSATTFGSRLNGAAGALTLSVAASTTGQFEDTTHSDTISVGDLVNRFVTTGSGTGNIAGRMYNDFETTTGATQYVNGVGAQTYAPSITRYEPLQGTTGNRTTESDVQIKAGVACTASLYEAYVSANTIVGASTLTFRKNAADGSGSVSITGLTTGWFEDTSNSDTITSTDAINWKLVTGAAGTTLTLEYLGVKMTLVTLLNFSMSGTGGLASGGVGVASVAYDPASSGGITAGGAAPASKAYDPAASGGIATAGAGVVSRLFNPAASGGILTGGAGAGSIGYNPSVSGGILTGGGAVVTIARSMSGAGGILTGGAGLVYRVIEVVAAGGITMAGAGTVSLAKSAIGAGGLVLGGAAATNRFTSYAFTASGGILTGGASITAVARSVSGTGGIVTAGAGLVFRVFDPVASGGIILGGAAATAYVGPATVALTGRLTVRGQFSGLTLVAPALQGAAGTAPSLSGRLTIIPD